ncbi:MAG: agmatinase [Acholeplasmatales bacterium]|nr:agmatinase [Acholeplasmatales bacterium]
MKKNNITFQSCEANYNESQVVIFSAPLDCTTSFRPGTRFAGNAIRVDSAGVEWYSCYQDKSLKDYKTCDLGEIYLPVGDAIKSLDLIYKTVKTILNDNKFPIMIGGEHLASYGSIKAVYEKYPLLRVIHFDAHTDLREKFLGMKFSHATFLRHVHNDFLGDDKIFSFGIRSGDKEEFEWAKTHIFMNKFNLDHLDEVIEKVKDYPVYVTIDLDVLDPSIFPGTGTPEAGGITFKEFLDGILKFVSLNNIVGFDMMELSPSYDPSGVSTAVACKTLRELILIAHNK